MSGVDALLNRRRPSAWQRFWQRPTVFLARQLYSSRLPSSARCSSPRHPAAVSVVCISDTHNTQPALPDGDVLIHAGDLTQGGSHAELQAAIDWLRSQPHRHKVVVAGNHDLLLDSGCDDTPGGKRGGVGADSERAQLDWGDIKYLQNTSTTIVCANGRRLKVHGSPWSPRMGNWAFQHPREENVWKDAIPDDADVLVTHGPPRAHLDLLGIGCVFLLDAIWRVRPRLHVFWTRTRGYGQEVLQYTPLQAAYERLVIARGGVWELLLCLWLFLGSPFRSEVPAEDASR
jgi:hypothetical protein